MVKKVSNINKKNYKQKQSSTTYIIAGLVVAVVIGVFAYINIGSGDSTTALAGPAPSGNNCPENVAYLQLGVDKFRETTGQIPTDVNQLTKSVEGKGPFVESIPACPSGNIYVISPDGVVGEAAPQ